MLTHRTRHYALLALILLAGLGLRFYQLGALPPGLYQDEAYNGLDALTVLDGARPLWFPTNNGREPFYIYMVAASVAVLGRTPLAERLPAALIGGLTILAAYALGRGLYHPRLGLLAAAVTAFTFWPVVLSRIGLRAGTLPLLLALSLACAAAGWRRPPRHLGLLALGGALLGLTAYTYLASRFVPLALLAFLVFWYSAQRRTFPSAREFASFLVPAALVALPLFIAGLRHPEILLGRAGQVSVLNPDINQGNLAGTLFSNLAAALGMFVWRGDDIARHNLPGRPVFDVFIGAAFLAGVYRLGRQVLLSTLAGINRTPRAMTPPLLARAFGVSGQETIVPGAQRSGRGPGGEAALPAALLLTWIATLLLPTILAEDTPHFLRAVGVLPAICLVAAIGLDWLWEARRLAAPLRRGLVVLALLAGGLLTARDYFGRYALAPDTAYLFQTAAAELAGSIQAGAAEGAAIYADQRFRDQFASLRFLVDDAHAPLWYLTAGPLPSTAAAAPVLVFAWPFDPVAPLLAGWPPGTVVHMQTGPLHRGDLEPAPYPLYAAVGLRPAGELPAPLARFEGGLNLLATTSTPAPGGGTVQLTWQAERAPGHDYQVFAMALSGEVVVAQADGPLGTAFLPSGVWRAGEVVTETRTFALPAGTAWEALTLRLGLYDLASGARLPRLDQPGDHFEITVTDRR